MVHPLLFWCGFPPKSHGKTPNFPRCRPLPLWKTPTQQYARLVVIHTPKIRLYPTKVPKKPYFTRIIPDFGRDVHRVFHRVWETFRENCGKVHRRGGSFPQGSKRAARGISRRFRADEKAGNEVTFFQKGVAFSRQVCYNRGVNSISYLPVAQLDSASDSDSEGRRFESFRVGQKSTSFDRSLSIFTSSLFTLHS